MLLDILNLIVSPIIDLAIFDRITKSNFNNNKLLYSLFCVLSITFSVVFNFPDYIVDVAQISFLMIYYFCIRSKVNKRLILGAILIFTLLDLIVDTLTTTIYTNIWFDASSINSGLVMIFLELVVYLFVRLKSKKIYGYLTDKNSSIFIILLIFVLIYSELVYQIILSDNKLSETFWLSILLLAMLIIFSIAIYLSMIKIQRDLLTKQEQEKQRVEKELAIAKQKEAEAENRELALKQEQVNKEIDQLKEYSGYLEKNEDDLRKFKHDYQNILNSLKLTAEEGNTDKVVELLDKYSKSQIDPKSLRKYKGVNHIKVEELKSITVAKLSKLYRWHINYAFGCDVDIKELPKSVDILDLTRIIGIAFDNAAEESKALNEELGNDAARVEVIYYQENNDFEFEITNKVRFQEINPAKISKKNYTTKKNHMGLGLSNLKEITDKYKNTMIVNYGINDGKFMLNLTILSDE